VSATQQLEPQGGALAQSPLRSAIAAGLGASADYHDFLLNAGELGDWLGRSRALLATVPEPAQRPLAA
jgi:hypothetical protein